MSNGVRIDITNEVLQIVFTKRERLNAVGSRELSEAATAIENVTDDIRLIVITGEGRAFCSGADLKSADMEGGVLLEANRLILAICGSRKLVLCAVNGLTVGIGCSIAFACDVILAKASAYFQLAFINIGLMPDGGATELVAASIGRVRANRMALLGDRLGASEAEHIGLISKSVDDEFYDDELSGLIDHFVRGPALAYAETKLALNANTLPSLVETLQRESDGQARLRTSEDRFEAGNAFIEKRRPNFVGR